MQVCLKPWPLVNNCIYCAKFACPLYKLPSQVKIGQLAIWLRLKQACSKNQHCPIQRAMSRTNIEYFVKTSSTSVVENLCCLFHFQALVSVALSGLKEPNRPNQAEDLSGQMWAGPRISGIAPNGSISHCWEHLQTSWKRSKSSSACVQCATISNSTMYFLDSTVAKASGLVTFH